MKAQGQSGGCGVHVAYKFARQIAGLLRDYAELTKARITTLIVLTAWCGYFFGAHRMGVSSWSLGLFHALFGIALVSSGTAALNEVMESSVDARMRRTALRPLPSGRMSGAHAATVGLALTLGGSAYLAIYANLLTGLLVFADCAGVSGGLHSAEESFSDLHIRWRVSGSHAGGAGLDSGTRASWKSRLDSVCHHVRLAVPAFSFDRVALSRGLCAG